jgi:hypothetical protein
MQTIRRARESDLISMVHYEKGISRFARVFRATPQSYDLCRYTDRVEAARMPWPRDSRGLRPTKRALSR